jgi:hypothetical protein
MTDPTPSELHNGLLDYLREKYGLVPEREHDETSPDCWCRPSVLQICPECNDDLPECWRCDGNGTIPCDNPAHYDGPHGLIYVHRYEGDGNDSAR